VSRLLTPEELKALRAAEPHVPAPAERFHIVVDAGHADLAPEEVSALVPGSVIPLDRAAGHPVEIVANAVTVARGELVEVRGRAAVRVLTLEHPRTTPHEPTAHGTSGPSRRNKR
jgi:flagellar motor switch protein FliM